MKWYFNVKPVHWKIVTQCGQVLDRSLTSIPPQKHTPRHAHKQISYSRIFKSVRTTIPHICVREMRAKRIEVMSADRVLFFTVAVMSGYISITRFCLSDFLRFRINQNYILSNYLKPCCMFGCLPVCENVLFCFFFIKYAVWVPRKGIFFWFVCYHVSYKIEQNVYFCLTWFCFLLACFVAPWLPYKYLFFLCYFFHRRSTQYCGLSFFQYLFSGVWVCVRVRPHVGLQRYLLFRHCLRIDSPCVCNVCCLLSLMNTFSLTFKFAYMCAYKWAWMWKDVSLHMSECSCNGFFLSFPLYRP